MNYRVQQCILVAVNKVTTNTLFFLINKHGNFKITKNVREFVFVY